MPQLRVTLRDGEKMEVPAENGLSVMENLRDGGVDEIMALCSGCLSCATCHVYVDEAFIALLPEMTEDESDLLDSSGVRQANSRLSCQIEMKDELDGLALTVAPE